MSASNWWQVNERHLYQVLSDVFPPDKIQRNVMKDINMKYPSTGRYMEMDLWIPDYQLCFEMQDSYHYMTTTYYQHTREYIKSRDSAKQHMAHLNGMTLIQVPCWWNGRLEQIVATICFQRPDIPRLRANGPPISLNPPRGFLQSLKIPGVGELMLASFPPFNFDVSASKWWLGEKYDGIRYCWHSARRQAYSRYGKELNLISNITRSLPNIFVDSELWFGRGQYSHTFALINETPNSFWPSLRVISFDSPKRKHQHNPYEKRYRLLLKNIALSHPFVVIPARMMCDKFLRILAQYIIDDGGEGVILQKYRSLYEQGRSLSLVKLKSAPGDQEGIIVAIDPDKSVSLKLPNGTTFSVTAENVFVPNLSVGDVVTFSNESNARSSLPLNPKIYRLRPDVDWEDLAFEDKNLLSEISHVKDFKSNPVGHWSKGNMRNYMESFAKSKNMDPLQPDTWYDSLKLFCKAKSGRTILRKFKNGYVEALQYLFPDVKFNPESFAKTKYYKIENRRKFLENYARENGFDPLNPNMWYLQPYDKIIGIMGARRVFAYHNNSLPQALCDLFPNIGLQKSSFKALRYDVWDTPESRRKFFKDYAQKYGFDSLKAENWYLQSKDRILAFKGGFMVMAYHNNDITKALQDLFPDIGIDSYKFQLRQNYWTNPLNRRKFFESYAKLNGIDPLNPEHWYSQPISKIMAFKGSTSAVAPHNSSVSKALVDLFPDIGLDRNRFSFRQNAWNNMEARRNFFEEYALKVGFDPLNADNWYTQPINKIMATKWVREVLSYHSYSLPKALHELFPNIGLDETRLKRTFRFKV
eukprot:Phypoly_transcript_01917.p1 GENE.Phypoly_transcript_01917~~Phypoly_transcript_01917.p1  ORF type:complete len:811 (+),score=69.95 Phypoly_transcript_01917:211-2643(+)